MSYLGRILEDGRIVMSTYEDIKHFFDANRIVGRKIVSIEPECLDYLIRNIEDFYPFEKEMNVSCGIETAGFISLVFEDGFTAEIEIPGEAPVILGTNGFPKDHYPENNGKAYLLKTMFRECIGKTIAEVKFEKTDHKMIFPIYKGIDMSDYDEGINEIRIILEDNSQLVLYGWEDFFEVDYRNAEDEEFQIGLRELLSELNEETKLKYGVVKLLDCPTLTTF